MELEKRGTGREEVEEYLLNYGIEKGGLMNYLRDAFLSPHNPYIKIGPTSKLCLPFVNKGTVEFYKECVCREGEDSLRKDLILEDIMVISRERLPAEKLYGLIETYYKKFCGLSLEEQDEKNGILSFSDGKRKVHVTLSSCEEDVDYCRYYYHYIISERL